MPEADPAVDCKALGQIIDRIADKWAVMTVGHLTVGGTLRFTELMRAIPGVSHRMLTLTLRALERDGIVQRTVQACRRSIEDEESVTHLGQVEQFRALSRIEQVNCGDAALERLLELDRTVRVALAHAADRSAGAAVAIDQHSRKLVNASQA